jgi:hypothetical protein
MCSRRATRTPPCWWSRALPTTTRPRCASDACGAYL